MGNNSRMKQLDEDHISLWITKETRIFNQAYRLNNSKKRNPTSEAGSPSPSL
jgi:hypothetical protein